MRKKLLIKKLQMCYNIIKDFLCNGAIIMNMWGIKSPCQNCIKRHVNCHNSSCSDWIEFNKALEEKRKLRKSQSEISYQMNSMIAKRVERCKKGR